MIHPPPARQGKESPAYARAGSPHGSRARFFEAERERAYLRARRISMGVDDEVLHKAMRAYVHKKEQSEMGV